LGAHKGVCLRDEAGEPIRFAGTQTDLTTQKAVQQQALYETLHDPLTGLANRTLLLERVGQALLRHQKDVKNSFALLFVGLELFKSTVETSYVDQTDWILQEAGKRLLEVCRHDDTVARWGGDHFIIFLDGYQDEEDLKVLSLRLLENLSLPFVVPSQEIVIPAYLGIAVSTRAYESADDAIWDAESAYFYAEKNTSRTPVFFEQHMRKKAKSFFQLHANLRQAIDQEEIFVVLQPIFDLQEGYMVGIETLARWHHPRFGIVLPDTFFQLAEDESLKLSLENLILHKACYAYQSWPQETKPSFFTMNLSYKTLEDNDFANSIFDALKEHSIAPEQLKIELSEKSLDAAGDSIHWVLKRLMKKGLGFMIDDFGQAGTSLSLLHSGLFEYVKLARTLSAPTQTKELIMAKSIMTLCQTLSLGLIAKGIETTAEQDLFQRNGGRFAQGYHFSHPLTLDEARELPRTPPPSS
jgi:diguanylate cyclase (GGDEF)-like protein